MPMGDVSIMRGTRGLSVAGELLDAAKEWREIADARREIPAFADLSAWRVRC